MKYVASWVEATDTTITKLDSHTILLKGTFGGFTANGVAFTVSEVYFVRPSAHLYTGTSMVMELNAIGVSAIGTTTTLVVLMELQNMPDYDVFMYTAGFGTGETQAQQIGETRKNYDVVNMDLAFPTPSPGETVLHYFGDSMFGDCSSTYYLISKITIIINPDQLNELESKVSNYPVNPMKIVVYDDKKPKTPPANNTTPPKNDTPPANETKPPTPTPPENTTNKDPATPADPPVFDPKLYNQTYPTYPPPVNNTPPLITFKYPNPDFPYPCVWPWTGQPNFPNDPWYPLFIWPPQPIFPPQPVLVWPVWPNLSLPKEWPPLYYPANYSPNNTTPYYKIPDPPLITFDKFYKLPQFPDQSPQWPFGKPIWPSASGLYPLFPQNWDFFPKYNDPYNYTLPQAPKNNSTPNNTTNGTANNTTPPNNTTANNTTPNVTTPATPLNFTPLVFPFVIHPLLPIPIYTYMGPFTSYPHFPLEHWPDNPFDPRLYPGFPLNPNWTVTPLKPPQPVYPTDPKLRWPQNPYYTWPSNPDYIWPKEMRFIWPTTPNDPKWIWPADPTLDPKWRQPADPSWLPPPLPQRLPSDPVLPNQTINNSYPNNTSLPNNTTPPAPAPNSTQPATPAANNTSPNATAPNNSTANNTTPPIAPPFSDPATGLLIPFAIPNVSDPPKPHPGFTYPDPNNLIQPPYAPPPFPISPDDIPSVYKGIPNQPFGLIPPQAIPIWQPVNPKSYCIIPRPPPEAPVGAKWIIYIYYPIPFRCEYSGKIALVPQYILVNLATPVPTSLPASIPILIIPPIGVVVPDPSTMANPNQPKLVEYYMPVLFKPVDPAIQPKIYRRDGEILADQARLDKNTGINNWNKNHTPPPPNNSTNPTNNTTTPPNPNNPANPANPSNPANPTNPANPANPANPPANGTNPPPANGTNPPPANGTNPNGTAPANGTAPNFNVTPTTNNGTIIYDNNGRPVRELVGYDTVCDKWRIGVLVNRHFKQGFEWSYSDYELDNGGEYRYCVAYRQVPRFIDLTPELLAKMGLGPDGKPLNASANGTNGTNGNGTGPGGAGSAGAGGANGTGAAGPGMGATTANLPSYNANKIRISVPCSSTLSIVLNDRNFNVDKETADSLGKKCSIWVNNQVEAQNYIQHQKDIAANMQTGTVTQLAFLNMVQLKYDA